MEAVGKHVYMHPHLREQHTSLCVHAPFAKGITPSIPSGSAGPQKGWGTLL